MLFAFGERLRQLRHEKNYTMGMVEDRLAQKNVSIGQSALGKYEAGRTYPNLETAAALADIFDVSLDYLAMGSKSKTLTLQDLSEEQITGFKRGANQAVDRVGGFAAPAQPLECFSVPNPYIGRTRCSI